jgi:hypothetical protein
VPDLYSTAVINARLQQTVDPTDAGPANGLLLEGAGSVVTSFQLERLSGFIVSGVLTTACRCSIGRDRQ